MPTPALEMTTIRIVFDEDSTLLDRLQAQIDVQSEIIDRILSTKPVTLKGRQDQIDNAQRERDKMEGMMMIWRTVVEASL